MSKSKRKMTYKEVIKYYKKKKNPKTSEQLLYLASLKKGERRYDPYWYSEHLFM